MLEIIAPANPLPVDKEQGHGGDVLIPLEGIDPEAHRLQQLLGATAAWAGWSAKTIR